MASSADIAYPEHGVVGLGKFFNALGNRQPDFSQLNRGFANLGSSGPLVRGGQFMDPSQAQQYATPSYLQGRGQIAQNDITSMFQDAQLMAAIGAARGNIAAMIPQLKAQQTQLNSIGLFGGML